MLLVAVNKIVASLLPVCSWIQRDTRCRDTGNMLSWCKRGLRQNLVSNTPLLLLSSSNLVPAKLGAEHGPLVASASAGVWYLATESEVIAAIWVLVVQKWLLPFISFKHISNRTFSLAQPLTVEVQMIVCCFIIIEIPKTPSLHITITSGKEVMFLFRFVLLFVGRIAC